ncbi:zinc finger, CCHC-type containing protein [Tanacetum coccineum]
MAEIFGLLKELTTYKAPKKVLIREEAKSPVTKNVNSISLARGEEEWNNDNDVATGDDIEKPTRTETKMPDVLVEVAEHVYPVDFMIFDIKEDENRPFILGTPFLTTAKAMIKFNKGTITLRSGKSKISFHMIPKSLCKSGKGIKNDIEPIAPTMTVNKLVLEWEEKIKLQQEKEMEFDRWRNKNFKNECPAPVKIVDEMDDEGEVT